MNELQNYIESCIMPGDGMKSDVKSDDFTQIIKTAGPNLDVKYDNTKSPTLALIYLTHERTFFDLNEFEQQMRTSIIDLAKQKVLCLCPVLDRNNLVDITNMEINSQKATITESLEGSQVIMYHHNGKWKLSTRRAIDANKTFWKSKRSIGEQFKQGIENSLKESGTNYKDFLDGLSTDYSHVFVLTSHESKTCIDYSQRWGEGYVKVHLLNSYKVSDGTTLNTSDSSADELEMLFGKHVNSILRPVKYEDLSILNELNRNEHSITSIRNLYSEGCILYNHSTGKYSKLQTDAYKVYQESSDCKVSPGTPEHFIRMYQLNRLDMYAGKFSKDMDFKPQSSPTPLNVKGLVDVLFKVLSIELHDLFRSMWHIGNGKKLENGVSMYQLFPSKGAYRDMFYYIRGAFFAYKNSTPTEKFGIKHVMAVLKTQSPTDICKVWRERIDLFKAMSNMSESNDVEKSDDESLEGYDKLVKVFSTTHSKPFIVGLLSMTQYLDEFIVSDNA